MRPADTAMASGELQEEISDTPRTDAAEYPAFDSRDGCVDSDFARTLERECAALRRDAERYRWLRDGGDDVRVEIGCIPRSSYELDCVIDSVMQEAK